MCCVLNRATHTPIPFWLEMTPPEMGKWFESIEAAARKLPSQGF